MTPLERGDGPQPSLKDIVRDFLPPGFADMDAIGRGIYTRNRPIYSVLGNNITAIDAFIARTPESPATVDSIEFWSALCYDTELENLDVEKTLALLLSRVASIEIHKLGKRLDRIQDEAVFTGENPYQEESETIQDDLSRYGTLRTNLHDFMHSARISGQKS